MAGLESRDFSSPDETRTPDKRTVELVNIAGGQVNHVGCCLQGRLVVRHDDGSEVEVAAGEVYRTAPGHDAWVVGDEPAVAVEFQGATHYAEPAS